MIGKFFDHLEEHLLLILFPIMTFIVLLATAVRYLKLGAIPWSEELARYIMIWMAYIGASLGIKRNAHFGVEAFVKMLPSPVAKYVRYFKIAIIILFNALIIYYTIQIMGYQITSGQSSPALQIPICLAYLALPCGAFLMIIRVIQSAFASKKEVFELHGQKKGVDQR